MLHHLMLVADPAPETKLKTQPEPYRRILLGTQSGEIAGDQEAVSYTHLTLPTTPYV